MSDNVLYTTDPRGVATITLNRPEKHNAFDDQIIAELTGHLMTVKQNDDIRVLVLAANGKSFSAGADIRWMRSMAAFDETRNVEDALRLAELMMVLNDLSIPTVARVNGPVYGGGVGLVACCDIAVASINAKFALSEVRLGLVPSVISPYVLNAIGQRQARRFFLTGEAIEAAEARLIGLVHAVVAPDELDTATEKQVAMLLQGGPRALRACKDLIASEWGAGISVSRSLKMKTAELIAQLRVSEEGQEGLTAFLEKRSPSWARRD